MSTHQAIIEHTVDNVARDSQQLHAELLIYPRISFSKLQLTAGEEVVMIVLTAEECRQLEKLGIPIRMLTTTW